jgi:hypothetical protein
MSIKVWSFCFVFKDKRRAVNGFQSSRQNEWLCRFMLPAGLALNHAVSRRECLCRRQPKRASADFKRTRYTWSVDINEIYSNLEAVLKEERRAYTARGRAAGALGSLNVGTQSLPNFGWTAAGEIPVLLFPESARDAVASPNATLLLKLYSTLTDQERVNFRVFLNGTLHTGSEYASVAYFVFFVLYRIGYLTDALRMARNSLVGAGNYAYGNLLLALSMIVSREYLEISPGTYDEIRAILIGDREHNFQLMEKINGAKLKHLEASLSDVNPEINSDRDRVLDLWGKTFSSSEVPSLVREIEDYFREGDLVETKFATCISRIRVLLVEVAKRMALKAADDKPGVKISENSADHYFMDYLKNSGQITSEEWKVMKSLYDMTSVMGAHASISNREYARLVKNMSYEIVLLFLTKSPI